MSHLYSSLTIINNWLGYYRKMFIYTLTFSLGYKKEYSLSSGDLAKMEKNIV